jgi:hypothetical protein
MKQRERERERETILYPFWINGFVDGGEQFCVTQPPQCFNDRDAALCEKLDGELTHLI